MNALITLNRRESQGMSSRREGFSTLSILSRVTTGFFLLPLLFCLPSVSASGEEEPERQVFFGDLHVHTKYSFDAFIFGTRADPDDAYRFAKGEALMHPAGIQMKLGAPLDFLAVADHATYLGMFEKMYDPASRVGKHPLSKALQNVETPEGRDAIFQEILPRERGYIDFEDDLLDLGVVRSAWQEIVDAPNDTTILADSLPLLAMSSPLEGVGDRTCTAT